MFHKSKLSCTSYSFWHLMSNRYAKIITEHKFGKKKKKCFYIMNRWSSLGIFTCPEFKQGMIVVTENTILESQNRLGLIKGRDEHSQSGHKFH